MKDFEKKAKAYALKNAVSHDGKASTGPVISGLFNEGLKSEDVKKYSKKIAEIVEEVNSLSQKDQVSEFSKLKESISERKTRVGLHEIPNSEKGIVTRFAPSASGPMHVGHALTSSLSYLYYKKYGGKFYLRIEDTNPENSFKDSYKLLKDDADWLFEKNEEIVIQSERMELYYSYAEKLIKKGFAFVCVCSSGDFRNFVLEKKNCPCMENTVERNMELWKEMLGTSDKGKFDEGEVVLRFKNEEGMQHKNPAMRSFPLARINLAEHPKVGKKYRVWPLMNLAVSVDDLELGVTHIIRAKDHRDNTERQRMIFEALGKKNKIPWSSFLGRIKFKDMDLSTTKMRKEIQEGKYSGWNDEKLPTLKALKKKGYKPEAFWRFALRIGLSENDKVMDKKEFFTLLEDFNKMSGEIEL